MVGESINNLTTTVVRGRLSKHLSQQTTDRGTNDRVSSLGPKKTKVVTRFILGGETVVANQYRGVRFSEPRRSTRPVRGAKLVQREQIGEPDDAVLSDAGQSHVLQKASKTRGTLSISRCGGFIGEFIGHEHRKKCSSFSRELYCEEGLEDLDGK